MIRGGQGRLASWASKTKRSLIDPVTTHLHATVPVGEQLGTRLMLPAQYERRRTEIEQAVSPLKLPNQG